jgi:hypothetical protein
MLDVSCLPPTAAEGFQPDTRPPDSGRAASAERAESQLICLTKAHPAPSRPASHSGTNSFEGAVENLYTTLVVKLYYGGIFRLQVSMAARVEAKAEGGGIWVSAQVKKDIDTWRAAKHSQLRWTEHADEELKGFPRKCTLWSVE